MLGTLWNVKRRKMSLLISWLHPKVQNPSSGQEVVVVAVVYLTTNHCHLGYLSSGNGHLAGRYSTPYAQES